MPIIAAAASKMSIPSGKTDTEVPACIRLNLFPPVTVMITELFLQVPLYPERQIQACAKAQDSLSWKGDLLAVGIYSNSLHVKGRLVCPSPLTSWGYLFYLLPVCVPLTPHLIQSWQNPLH